MHWRRQSPIGHYVVNFCCTRSKLAVEIDSDSHYLDDAIRRDAARTAFLQAKGVRLLRFSNDDVEWSAEGAFKRFERFARSRVPTLLLAAFQRVEPSKGKALRWRALRYEGYKARIELTQVSEDVSYLPPCLGF